MTNRLIFSISELFFCYLSNFLIFHGMGVASLRVISGSFRVKLLHILFILRIRLTSILSIYRLLRSTGFVANQSHLTPARVAKLKYRKRVTRASWVRLIFFTLTLNPMENTYAWRSRNTPVGERRMRKRCNRIQSIDHSPSVVSVNATMSRQHASETGEKGVSPFLTPLAVI